MPGMANAWLQLGALVGVGVYFAVQSLRALMRYCRFRRRASQPLATWRTGRPLYFSFYLALGVVSGFLAIADGIANGKWIQFFSQASIAAYFLIVIPLTLRVEAGLYEAGVWSDGRYLDYSQVGRWTVVERPAIALLLLPKMRSRVMRLAVPTDEYGAVMKVISLKLPSVALTQQNGILDLK
jgi:hypothetical protein